jgi:mannosyl-oligosaccharide alpha-1,2-mannosidase
MPLSGRYRDPFVSWAATIVDALNTLYIMEMKDKFADTLIALEQINFSEPNSNGVSVFETTMRYLKGLLGAWDISGHRDPILLEKETQLKDLLYCVFDTESGIPVPYYLWEKHVAGKLAGENGVLLAKIRGLTLEFICLSQVTGDPKYANAVQKITDKLE